MGINRKQKLFIFLLVIFGIIGGVCLLHYLYYLNINKLGNLNVILITIDALRADHIGYYGYKKETTPFLDSFSKNAFIFINAIAQSASTMPSISSIFTSKYPFLDCVVDSSYRLGNKYITIAEFLRENGYSTFGIVGHYYVSKKFGFSRGFNYFDDNFNNFRTADEIRNSVIGLVNKINKNKKFFLWLHFREPHSPYNPPVYYIKMFSELFEGKDETKIYTIYGKKLSLSGKTILELMAAYDANIRFVDDNLRKLFEYLKREHLIKKSIIIVTADHGESLGEHNIFDHNELYYGIIRVPLIIKVPYSKGGIISSSVSLIDIFPTILDLLGYKDNALKLNLRGKNLFLNRGTNEIQFSEFPDRYSIINNGWRIFLDEKGDYKLYNLKDDPQELNNLVSVEKEKFEFLKQKLDAYKQVPTQDKIIKSVLDEETKKRLESLGYVQ